MSYGLRCILFSTFYCDIYALYNIRLWHTLPYVYVFFNELNRVVEGSNEYFQLLVVELYQSIAISSKPSNLISPEHLPPYLKRCENFVTLIKKIQMFINIGHILVPVSTFYDH